MRAALLLLALLAAAPARGQPAEDRAVERARQGERLFAAGNFEGALVEFELAYRLVPRSDYLFNMAQCEYHLDRLRDAHAHYAAYLKAVEQEPGARHAEIVEIAQARLEAIENRPGVLVINTVPDAVEVRIQGKVDERGEAPNQFRVPSGRYRVLVSKKDFATQSREVEIGFAETRHLFFKLDPLPARLEVRTSPRHATLYVRGNRAQNPYVQQVEPGSYEIYAEAVDHAPRRDVVTVAPGQHLPIDFRLEYVQRSGRPELIWFWTAAGALAGGTAVLARLEDPKRLTQSPASGTLVFAGALAGGIGGAVVSTAFAPSYIPDNRALFRIGAMWVGAVQGASVALTAAGELTMTAGWIGGAVGLGAGAAAGALLDHRSPTYGRVAMIQSAAGVGTIAGALAVPALVSSPSPAHYPVGVLAGLNAGLAAGLALAYLPDQRRYGPSWQRVVLVDLAGAAGLFAGGLVTTVDHCLTKKTDVDCRFDTHNQSTARFAIGGAALGLAAGWLLTLNYDRDRAARTQTPPPPLPVPTALPVQAPDGTTRLLPGLAAQGRF